ncbi:hypothetical protein ACSQ67_013832 [Phaseolus vulgaris]
MKLNRPIFEGLWYCCQSLCSHTLRCHLRPLCFILAGNHFSCSVCLYCWFTLLVSSLVLSRCKLQFSSFPVQNGMIEVLFKLTQVRGDLVCTVATETVDMGREYN